MASIVSGEALGAALTTIKTVTDSIDTKATQAQTTANAASTAAQTADTKATQAQTTANAASTAASNAASAAQAAQTSANAASTAAQNAQTTANGKQTKLYKHHIVLDKDTIDNYVKLDLYVINTISGNLTLQQIVDSLNDKSNILLCTPTNDTYVVYRIRDTFNLDGTDITGYCYYYNTDQNNVDDDSLSFRTTDTGVLTQTVTAL